MYVSKLSLRDSYTKASKSKLIKYFEIFHFWPYEVTKQIHNTNRFERHRSNLFGVRIRDHDTNLLYDSRNLIQNRNLTSIPNWDRGTI